MALSVWKRRCQGHTNPSIPPRFHIPNHSVSKSMKGRAGVLRSTVAASAAMRTIKRYANRKLYDVQESHYVTLEMLAGLVRQGEDFHTSSTMLPAMI